MKIQNDGVLVSGSAPTRWQGVPGAGIRDCASDETNSSLDTVLLAIVTIRNSNKQGSTPSSIRISRQSLNSAGRNPVCVNARQGYVAVRLENGCTESCSGIPEAVNESKSRNAKFVLSGRALRGSPVGTNHPTVSSKEVMQCEVWSTCVPQSNL